MVSIPVLLPPNARFHRIPADDRTRAAFPSTRRAAAALPTGARWPGTARALIRRDPNERA
ncbi:hypothetical protein GCM10010440_45740 [Kitasatospora cinereorecta]